LTRRAPPPFFTAIGAPIANTTGVMRLDPGSTDAQPSVRKTSTPAILWVMIEVCIFTALLGLAMHALGGLQVANGDVNAPSALSALRA
jgi:hypothetical protein